MKVYQYPRCSTCRKALRWLDEHSVAHVSVDIVQSPPPLAELKRALKLLGEPVAKLFNTSGISYREGGFKAMLPKMTDTEALMALAADGKLIKRPLIVGKDFAMVGFDQDRYRARFG
jgi:arsenate reductase